ncbi:hypothetical protein JTB14_017084 [Gonioctena quinquepunctata]|nr:hypothetical protein JTB14_017084 [Gonioctena quinquepunctata]
MPKKENEEIVEKLEKLQYLINSLMNEQENHERYIRRKKLLFFGVKGVNNEKCDEVILEIVNKNMNLNMNNRYRYRKLLQSQHSRLFQDETDKGLTIQ